ncbi:hypothetical protein DITRI_Ditri01bG0122900 [Diplodiscus trichospermus]
MGAMNINGVAATTESQQVLRKSFTMSRSYVESKEVSETKELVAELCRHFYTLGWLRGLGGASPLKCMTTPFTDQASSLLCLLLVSGFVNNNELMLCELYVRVARLHVVKVTFLFCGLGVQKERMVAEDMFVLSSDGFMLSRPLLKPYPYQPPKCTDCAPLFPKAYEICNAGAVIHSHGMEACLVTMINPFLKEFRITHMEMIKGIQGHGYHDELVVPIIENTAHKGELIESLTEDV